jgi:hypothetical protein
MTDAVTAAASPVKRAMVPRERGGAFSIAPVQLLAAARVSIAVALRISQADTASAEISLAAETLGKEAGNWAHNCGAAAGFFAVLLGLMVTAI